MRPLIAALLLVPLAAAADEYNYQNLLVGTRSTGMAAADVAFADSVTGAFYNPGGIVDADARLVSVSLSAYRVDLSGFSNIEARAGKAGRAAGFQFNSFPLNFGLITRVGDGLGLTDHTLALNFFVEDHSIGGSRVDVRIPQVADLYLRVRRQAQETVRFGPAWAARKGPVSVGVAAAYQVRVENLLVDTLVDIDDSVTYRLQDVQGLQGGVLAQAGVLWRGPGGLRVGLTASSPSYRVHGSSVRSQVELRTATQARLDPSSELPMTYRTPWRAALGVGYQLRGGARLAAHATWFSAVPRYQVVPGVVEAEGRMLVNYNLGLSVPVTGTMVLRLGGFTNFAASPPPPDQVPDRFDDPARLPHLDYFGATVGASLLSGASSMDLSLVYQYGAGKLPAEASRGYDPARGQVIVFMLGGTYSFADAVAQAAGGAR